ncbi:hypothetical protein GQ600_8797 [Phytophthora cactorum]|nr:hypothetical protein GQ600_8797 [Phytophthora cactorum]
MGGVRDVYLWSVVAVPQYDYERHQVWQRSGSLEAQRYRGSNSTIYATCFRLRGVPPAFYGG